MDDTLVAKVTAHPRYQELKARRTRLGVWLTIAMLIVYYGFILLVAFAKGFLGTPISASGVTTIGIPIGLFVIISAFVLTGIYVSKANTTFDDLNTQILKDSL